MPVEIQNLTNSPVLFRLNSGQTLHLSPNTTSAEIMEVEIKGNSKVEKLSERHVIKVRSVKETAPEVVEPKTDKAGSTMKQETAPEVVEPKTDKAGSTKKTNLA